MDERYLTTGHERDWETGLDYRGARFHDSEVGRFLSLDPMAADFASWSAYNYVVGNPITLVDKDGKAPGKGDDDKKSYSGHYKLSTAWKALKAGNLERAGQHAIGSEVHQLKTRASLVYNIAAKYLSTDALQGESNPDFNKLTNTKENEQYGGGIELENKNAIDNGNSPLRSRASEFIDISELSGGGVSKGPSLGISGIISRSAPALTSISLRIKTVIGGTKEAYKQITEGVERLREENEQNAKREQASLNAKSNIPSSQVLNDSTEIIDGDTLIQGSDGFYKKK